MNNVSISSPFSGGVTIIPNQFIEHYMIHANGEFVKIYLYLMHVSEHHNEFSFSQIADALNCTESDVRRALKYWEKEGLLSILPTNSRKPQTVSFVIPAAPAALNASVKPQAATDQTATVQIAETQTVEDPAAATQTAAAQTAETLTVAAQVAPSVPKYRPLTADRVRQLKENEEIAELLFIAQQYLKKPLSPTETNKILYFYEDLQFSTDLIEYLIEYCVSKGHKSLNYMEKVAFGWKSDGITSVKEAKKSAANYHKDYYTILKALGIRGRDPIDAEIAIMKTWNQDYGFSLDIIVEACTRTILATKQPSMQYADRILQKWKESNVHTMSDIQRLDLAHEQSKSEKTPPKTAKPGNRFSNFEQRSYDYESLESQLLNR